MGVLYQDVRFATRMLLKNPAFTLAAVLTLALAIGVNTAMFSVVNTAVLAPLPFEDSERLVRMWRQPRDASETRGISYLDYREYRERCDSFDELVAWCYMPMSVGVGDATKMRFGQLVTGNYFESLGIEPACGRLFTSEDNRTPGAHPVVVLSYRYWQRAYGGRSDVIGETVLISGHPFTIVGVAPRGFSGILPVSAPELWAPLVMLGEIHPEDRTRLEERGSGMLMAFGRLKPGVSLAQAQAEVEVVAAQLKDVDPVHYEDEFALLVSARGIIPMTPNMRRIALALTTLIMAMVGLVLIVGCANVANLLLARSAVRRKEIGIRLAIGASRLRIVRQLLTESVLLSVLGGAAGLVFALWTTDLLLAALPDLPYGVVLDLDFGLDGRVLGFTAIVALLSGILFGLVPALGVTRGDLASSLRDESSGAAALGARRSRLRNGLVVAQVAVSLVLLIGAGLFVRSLMRAQAIEPGFEHERVLAVMLDLGAHDYDAAATRTFYDRLLDRTRALPGVESASVEDCPPLSMAMTSEPYWIEDRPFSNPEEAQVSTAASRVSPASFQTLGIALRRGRDFNEQDSPDAPGVVIVNQAFANTYWPGEDPLGKRISRRGAEGPYLEVVGVVQTVKYRLIGEPPRPYIYRPLAQSSGMPFATLLVKTTGDPTAVVSPVREIIRELDANVAPMEMQAFTDLIAFALLPAQFAAGVFGSFGVLALLLASVGLYGVMSYSVSQRTREIGIRTTLGAQRADVVCLILKHGLTLTLIGLGIGLAISLVGTRVLASLLYEIGTTDPLTFVGVSLLLTTVALLACYLPARRAARVDPMVALRCE